MKVKSVANIASVLVQTNSIDVPPTLGVGIAHCDRVFFLRYRSYTLPSLAYLELQCNLVQPPDVRSEM